MPAIGRIGDTFSCNDAVAAGSPNVFVNNIPAARLGDATTGHGCNMPTTIDNPVTATVFVNGIPIALEGVTKNVAHQCPSVNNKHSGVLATASPNVFAE